MKGRRLGLLIVAEKGRERKEIRVVDCWGEMGVKERGLGLLIVVESECERKEKTTHRFHGLFNSLGSGIKATIVFLGFNRPLPLFA